MATESTRGGDQRPSGVTAKSGDIRPENHTSPSFSSPSSSSSSSPSSSSPSSSSSSSSSSSPAKPSAPQHGVVSLMIASEEDEDLVARRRTNATGVGPTSGRTMHYQIGAAVDEGAIARTPRPDSAVTESSPKRMTAVAPAVGSSATANRGTASASLGHRSATAVRQRPPTTKSTTRATNASRTTFEVKLELRPTSGFSSSSSSSSSSPSSSSVALFSTARPNATGALSLGVESAHRLTVLAVVVCSALAVLLPLLLLVLRKFFNAGGSNIKHRKLKSLPRDLLLASTGFAQTPFIEVGAVGREGKAKGRSQPDDRSRSGEACCRRVDLQSAGGRKSNRKTYPSRQGGDFRPAPNDFAFLRSGGGSQTNSRHFPDGPCRPEVTGDCPLHRTRAAEASDDFFRIAGGRPSGSGLGHDYQNWTAELAAAACRCPGRSEAQRTCSSTSSGYSTESSLRIGEPSSFQLTRIHDRQRQESLDARSLTLLPLKYTIANQHASDHLDEEEEEEDETERGENELQLVEIPLDSPPPPPRRKFVEGNAADCQPRRERLFGLPLLNSSWSHQQQQQLQLQQSSQDESKPQKTQKALQLLPNKPRFPKMGRICLMSQPKSLSPREPQSGQSKDEQCSGNNGNGSSSSNCKSLSSTPLSSSSSSSSASSSSSTKCGNAGKSPKVYASVRDCDQSGGYSQLLRRFKVPREEEEEEEEENIYCEIIKNKNDQLGFGDEKYSNNNNNNNNINVNNNNYNNSNIKKKRTKKNRSDAEERQRADDSRAKNGDREASRPGGSDYANLQTKPKTTEEDEDDDDEGPAESRRSSEVQQRQPPSSSFSSSSSSFSSKFYRYSFRNGAQYTPLVEKDAEKEAILLETDEDEEEEEEEEEGGGKGKGGEEDEEEEGEEEEGGNGAGTGAVADANKNVEGVRDTFEGILRK